MSNFVNPNVTQIVSVDIASGLVITPPELAGTPLTQPGPTGPTGPTGAQGIQGVIGPQGIPAVTFRAPLLAWCPTALTVADVGVPTQTDTWTDYVAGTVLTQVGGNTFSGANNTFTLTSGEQFKTSVNCPSVGTLFTILLLFKIDTGTGFNYILDFGHNTLRLYCNASPTAINLTDGTNFSSGGTIPSATYIPLLIAYGWNNPASPAANAGIYTIYDGHTGTWTSIGTMTSSQTPSGLPIVLHGSTDGTAAGDTFEYGSLLIFNYQPTSTETGNYLTILNTPTVPLPFRASLQGTAATDPAIAAAVATAPGLYGGLLRDTSASSGDQSTAIQTELTNNHHFEFTEREQRTAQHLLMPDDGYVNGNHGKLLGSSSYVAVEEDWIIGVETTAVGEQVQTLADPLFENLQTNGFSVPGIRDGTNYGNGPPVKTMAGIWFGDLKNKPSGFSFTVAHGRVLGGGAEFLTYGIRLTGFQYSRCEDVRVGNCDVGMLIESCNGEANVDWEVNAPIMYACLLGCVVVANNTMNSGAGAIQDCTVRGGKHNGGGVGSVCHWAAISPMWRIAGNPQIAGPITFEQNGTEFLLNDAAQYYSVGREFYTKELNNTAGTAGYLLGNPPANNLNGLGLLRQNANSTYWLCFYVPPCAFYVEGTQAIIRDPHAADNFGGYSGVFRCGPYGTAHVHNPIGAGQPAARIAVADDPTAKFYFYGTADGISGYAGNLFRWPDTFTYNTSAFDFFLAGGPMPEKEVYRVTQGNQPSWFPSSLSTSHQDNISEAVATRSPAFPALLQVTGAGLATTFSVVTASEGIFNGRKVTQMVYHGTQLTTLGTLSSNITTANNQPITPTLSANAPANGQLFTIDSEVFYVISGGGTTTPTLARCQQNSVPATHTAGANFRSVGAYLDTGNTGQQITTNWLLGYGSAASPGANVDTSAFVFIHNTSGTGFWINFDAFWSGNNKYSNGNTSNYNFVGRTWVGPHEHVRLCLGKGAYNSDYKLCWFFDAFQGAVTCYVSGLMMYQSVAGLDAGTHTRMMQQGEWVRNILQ